MTMQELAVVTERELPIKIFLFNNGYLGMVRQWEDRMSGGMHYETCLARKPTCEPGCVSMCERHTENPDFLYLDKAFPGLSTMRVKKTADVPRAIEHALSFPGPVLVDFWIQREADVLPMIPAGRGYDGAILR